MKKLRKPQAKRLIIWAAKGMFNSARKLKEALQPETQRKVLIVRSNSLRFKPRESDYVINWGNSHLAEWDQLEPVEILNHMGSVYIAVNKLKTFQALDGICNIPEWTTEEVEAAEWLNTTDVIARTNLTGFGGEGIVFLEKKKDFTIPAPLYVQYKKKKKEFRVHVFKGEVIDVTQKKKRKDFEGEVNTKIRNYANGWVYCREDIEEPGDLRTQATLAVHTLGLDFGAVDIIWNEKENKTYVLEVNTAPGICETTLEKYKQAFLSII